MPSKTQTLAYASLPLYLSNVFGYPVSAAFSCPPDHSPALAVFPYIPSRNLPPSPVLSIFSSLTLPGVYSSTIYYLSSSFHDTPNVIPSFLSSPRTPTTPQLDQFLFLTSLTSSGISLAILSTNGTTRLRSFLDSIYMPYVVFSPAAVALLYITQ